MPLAYAAILIGVLIFVHELGHFLVAKLFDVKVLRFSIGFGPKVIGFERGETEYVICALPLGGYVLMLGNTMESTEDIPEEDLSRALMAKPIWQRSLVTLAGPVFNLVFPVLIYFVVVIAMNSTTAPSMVGEPLPDMPAAEAGLKPGDRIVSIDGNEVKYWHQVIEYVTPNADEKLDLSYERDGKRYDVQITPKLASSTNFLGVVDENGAIGVHSGAYGPTLGIESSEGPAALAGLQNFDRVFMLDGKPIERFDEIESAVRSSAGEPLKFSVWRRDAIAVEYGDFYSQRRVDVEVTPKKVGEEWTIGVLRAAMFLSQIDPGSPVEKAGLQIGDQILSVSGTRFATWMRMNRFIESQMNGDIARTKDEKGDVSKLEWAFEIDYMRDGERKTTTLRPVVRQLQIEDYFRIVTGWSHMPDRGYPDDIAFPFGERVVYAAKFSVERTAHFTELTFLALLRLVQGRMSLDNLGGPITIGALAAQAGRIGWEEFLKMMALISINLGLINLLPIPVLDGGNLLLYALEAIKRGPLSFRTRQIAAYVGFSMILMLVVLALKNDIENNWDKIAEYVNEL